MPVEEKSSHAKEAYHSTSKNILGIKKRQHKEWISLETLDCINRRRTLKNKISQTKSERQRDRLRIKYAELNKLVKKGARADKRRFAEELAETAEKAASRNEMRTVHRITRQLCGEKHRRNIPVKDKQGNLLTSERDRDERWTEHFSEVLNRPEPELPPDIPPAQEDLDVRVDPPSRQEILNAIKSLKNNRATARMRFRQNFLKLTPSLPVTFSNLCSLTYGKRRSFHGNGHRGTLSKYQKKGILQIATIGGGLHYSRYLAKYSARWS